MRVAERGNIKQVHPILHGDEITVAEVLKTKGYATACFGKWDLAKHSQTGFFVDLFPTRQGFDYFFGTPTSNDRIVNLYRNEELIEPKSDMATLTKRYTDEAIGFMRRIKSSRSLSTSRTPCRIPGWMRRSSSRARANAGCTVT